MREKSPKTTPPRTNMSGIPYVAGVPGETTRFLCRSFVKNHAIRFETLPGPPVTDRLWSEECVIGVISWRRMSLLSPRLQLRVAQKQILTPGLVQMVTVLQLNRLELKQMINQEIVKNPVLEEATEEPGE